jgi:hypothetical protein
MFIKSHKNKHFSLEKKKKVKILFTSLKFVWILFLVPKHFKEHYSIVLEQKYGQILFFLNNLGMRKFYF